MILGCSQHVSVSHIIPMYFIESFLASNLFLCRNMFVNVLGKRLEEVEYSGTIEGMIYSISLRPFEDDHGFEER